MKENTLPRAALAQAREKGFSAVIHLAEIPPQYTTHMRLEFGIIGPLAVKQRLALAVLSPPPAIIALSSSYGESVLLVSK